MVAIRAGDVLLFRGRGLISKAIRFLDGSEVNHAAIALDAEHLAEATGHGLDTAPIAAAVERNERTWVLRSGSADHEAAAKRAAAYEADGAFYAYQQILLLAALCATRRIPIKNRFFRRVLRRLLDGAADLLNAFVDRGADLMICSEFVYRCYHETGYDLLPEGIPDLAAATPGSDDVLLLDWLAAQPAPVAPAVAAAAIERPDTLLLVDDLTFELDSLLVSFFADIEQDSAVPITLSADDKPDVLDEELVAAASRFSDATIALHRQRNFGAPEPAGLGPSDALDVLRGMFSTNANFVTPRDLFFTSRLTRHGDLP